MKFILLIAILLSASLTQSKFLRQEKPENTNPFNQPKYEQVKVVPKGELNQEASYSTASNGQPVKMTTYEHKDPNALPSGPQVPKQVVIEPPKKDELAPSKIYVKSKAGDEAMKAYTVNDEYAAPNGDGSKDYISRSEKKKAMAQEVGGSLEMPRPVEQMDLNKVTVTGPYTDSSQPDKSVSERIEEIKNEEVFKFSPPKEKSAPKKEEKKEEKKPEKKEEPVKPAEKK